VFRYRDHLSVKQTQRKRGNQFNKIVNCSRSWRVGAEILSDSDQHKRLKEAVEFDLHSAILGFDHVGRLRKPARPLAFIAGGDYTRYRD
jgi:hypothetical protein